MGVPVITSTLASQGLTDRARAAGNALGAAALVAPEAYLPGYNHPDIASLAQPRGGDWHGALAAFCRAADCGLIAGYAERDGDAVYTAGKGGLEALTRALAAEFGARAITVNAVAPGPVETDMFQGALAQGTPLDEVLKHIPMRRIATVDDVAGIVGFLCSDEASYITGQVIGVNGGMC